MVFFGNIKLRRMLPESIPKIINNEIRLLNPMDANQCSNSILTPINANNTPKPYFK
jgi:hypothetical protein